MAAPDSPDSWSREALDEYSPLHKVIPRITFKIYLSLMRAIVDIYLGGKISPEIFDFETRGHDAGESKSIDLHSAQS